MSHPQQTFKPHRLGDFEKMTKSDIGGRVVLSNLDCPTDKECQG